MDALAEPISAARTLTTPRPASGGPGRRLTAAFDAVGSFPALAESRNSILRLVREKRTPVGEVVAAVESDFALATMVLRMANRLGGAGKRNVATIPEAVAILTPEGVEQLAAQAPVFDFFASTPGWDHTPEQFRLHAVAVQSAADRLARELDYPRRDELLVAALLHDIGKLVLLHAYPAYPDQVHGDATTPEDRLDRERRELGVDHATVGGVLARRWGLPRLLATAIERHHSDDAVGDAAFLRVADMLAHYTHDDAVDPGELVQAARVIGLTPERLRALMHTLGNDTATKRNIDPCPLTDRETQVIKGLATGQLQKQIAEHLGLTTSTVRSHLHNIYTKLAVADRAQAVLLATDRGWI